MVKTCFVLALTALLAAGCNKSNPNYCAGKNPDNNCLEDAAGDSTTGCTSDQSCSGATPVCDLNGSKTCVQCTTTESSACSGTTPICGTDDTCGACTMHSQCASDVCLPDGSCSDGGNVAYVDPAGTDNNTCSKAMPCTKVAKALATAMPFVKFTGTTSEQVSINNQDVTLLADPGAQLTYSMAGVILKVDGTSTVKIYDLEIANGLGGTGIGISMPAGNTADLTLQRAKLTGNTGGGISASGGTLTVTQSQLTGNTGGGISASGGTLTVTQSQLTGNTGGGISASGGTLTVTQSQLTGNTGGGISASGGTLTVTQSQLTGNTGGGISITSAQFTIVNNFIAQNGAGTSGLGGVKIDTITSAGTHQMDFNTITANLGPGTVDTGVSCGTVVVPLVFDSNIIFDNIVSMGGTQIGGSANCMTTYSDIGPDSATGTGNINMDPAFVNVSGGDFHITNSSPCKDTAATDATVTVDIDGDSRPQGNGYDIGADEYKP